MTQNTPGLQVHIDMDMRELEITRQGHEISTIGSFYQVLLGHQVAETFFLDVPLLRHLLVAWPEGEWPERPVGRVVPLLDVRVVGLQVAVGAVAAVAVVTTVDWAVDAVAARAVRALGPGGRLSRWKLLYHLELKLEMSVSWNGNQPQD